MSDNLKELIKLGRPYLKQYLEDQGIKITKHGQNSFINCIHPDHEDKNPSCGLMRSTDDEIFHCFSCLSSGDIYQAAHYLENKPLFGLGFITDNLYYILDKYGIPYEKVEFTDEQLSNLKYDTVYNKTADLLVSVDTNTDEFLYISTKLANNRGWGDSICRTIGVGSVKNYDKFLTALSRNTTISTDQLIKMGITKNLFGPNLITFTVRDHQGNVKGFAARDNNWDKNSPTPKYTNTSLDANPFYRKDRLLFCLDRAKKYKEMRLDIFEGYGSAMTAQQAGLKNCCSIGGTALTEEHVDLIRNIGFSHINIVLDADKTGSAKMDNYIDKFSGYNGLEVTITRLQFSAEDKKQQGANDPDYYIQKYGLEGYKSNKPITLFEHMLEKEAVFEEDDPLALNFCQKMIKLVTNEPDLIKRGRMINSLSKHTHIDKDDIKAQIEKIEQTDIKNLRYDLGKKIQYATDVDQIQDILNRSLSKIENTGTTKKDRHLMSVGETLEVFEDIFTEINTATEGIHGWPTGFEALDDLLDGIPKPGKNGGKCIGFAGAASHGKSSALLNIVLRVVLNNDNISCLYWAIDDHRKTIAYRLIPMLSGVSARKVLNMERRTDEEFKAIKEAEEMIRELISEKKLIFKDDKFGRSKNKAQAWIESIQEQTGNEILFCVDSLHNVQGVEGEDTRVKLLNNSTWLKSLTSSIPCTALATLELIKNRERGKKPNLMSISETVKIEFDFDIISIVWNAAQGSYCHPSKVDAKWGSEGNWKPIIELDFQKNKAGAGQKGSVYFNFDPDTTSFISCSKEMMQEIPKQQTTIEGRTGHKYHFSRPKIDNDEYDQKTDTVENSETGW
jgi:DNA primase catalytic core